MIRALPALARCPVFGLEQLSPLHHMRLFTAEARSSKAVPSLINDEAGWVTREQGKSAW